MQTPYIFRHSYLRNGKSYIWSPFLHHLVALVKCWSHTKSKATVLNHIGARDKNVTSSDYCKYQTFVPNFRKLLLSPLKKTLRMPDVEYMIIYPYYHWPPNFSPQGFLNWLQWGFKWILLLLSIFRHFSPSFSESTVQVIIGHLCNT